MDPTATLAQIRHPNTDPDDRIDLAIDLAEWVQSQGFIPAGETRGQLLADLGRIITPPRPADDARLEAAYADRNDMEVDW
jgi:hypothetical protein